MANGNYLSFALLVLLGCTSINAMDCTLGQSKNILEQIIKTCPRPLIDSESESYCCWQANGDNVECCNLSKFVFNSISLALPIIIICLVVSFVVSCVCCLCCPCCPCNKRRGSGRVHWQGPMIITTGPYAVPPTAPYQPLSDGRGGYALA